MSVAVVSRYDERAVLDSLRTRYASRHVVAEHVRSAAGFDAYRTCDFMALDVRPSSGLALHGFEVKVSRSDWLRELREPEKAAEFMRICDFWWLVATPGVAQVDELPPGWGLLVAFEEEVPARTLFPGYGSDRRESVLVLRQVKAAPRLSVETGRPLPRSFTAALLRSATRRRTTRLDNR